MLVLRRKQGETIVLNEVVKVHILAIEGSRVKIGVEAPADVIVVRQELLNEAQTAVPTAVVAQEE